MGDLRNIIGEGGWYEPPKADVRIFSGGVKVNDEDLQEIIDKYNPASVHPIEDGILDTYLALCELKRYRAGEDVASNMPCRITDARLSELASYVDPQHFSGTLTMDAYRYWLCLVELQQYREKGN